MDGLLRCDQVVVIRLWYIVVSLVLPFGILQSEIFCISGCIAFESIIQVIGGSEHSNLLRQN